VRFEEQIRRPDNPWAQKALWGLLIVALIGVIGTGTWSLLFQEPASRQPLSVGLRHPPVYGSVPHFSLVERSGRKIERVEFLGKIWVVDLIYTHCPDTCPLQSAEMARLQADLVNEPDVRLVSITVDPARDTPKVLSRYARRFGADPKQWLFLTGDKEAIYRFAQEGLRLPVMDPRSRGRVAGGEGAAPRRFDSRPAHLSGSRTSAQSARPRDLLRILRRMLEPSSAMASGRKGKATLLHSSRLVLVDREARIRGYYESRDMESLRQLREDVEALLRKE